MTIKEISGYVAKVKRINENTIGFWVRTTASDAKSFRLGKVMIKQDVGQSDHKVD